jgi:hypothetical protein
LVRVATSAAFAGLFLCVGAACTNRPPGPYHAAIPPGPTAEAVGPSADVGRVVYLRDCAWCHGALA